ncbi:hypothetical protein TanjilG_23631 [Lupinus angustifolius]|uniref:glucomannan 4-beta-mannosyltransferase n=1 Tax=Lupinus angustifolius TaxID=3871 RepID=A0A4P1RA27_LUPAN|nr:hypothetical protein TanjilG_23631 [Lupinus angustifolius]
MGESEPKFFIPEAIHGVSTDLFAQVQMIWDLIKAPLIVPMLNAGVVICLVMALMLFFERLYMGIVIVLVKLFWKKPEQRYRYEPIQDDVEVGSSNFPVVLIQIPMFNEKEVYKVSIGAACGLSWPSDRLVIQVLDDSTDLAIKQLVEMECQRWASKGLNITYQIRENRTGYKAGALKEGLKRSYVKHCEYVAIFDADFRPEPDFLRRAIPFLVGNPDIALVQARWRFVNSDECLLTRMQEMSLDYHFTVEQEVGSATHAFFGFNGTAGVWRLAAISEAGGWKDRTTVEDMDLAVRASLRGWKFVYLGDLQRVRFWKKVYVIYSFFFVRKIIAHMVTFFFYCVVLPLTILVPEVHVPIWGAVYIPSIITILNSVGTPRSIHLLFYWILFENVMSLHRTKATLIGLFEAGRVNEWVVTEKLGDSVNNNKKDAAKKTNVKAPKKRSKFFERFQQHRWSCGPANLFRKMVMEIIRNKRVRFWKKVYVIYSFFFVRKIIAHMVTFFFYCVVLPLTILVPEVHVPIWGAVYIPSIITILNSVGTPRSIHLLFYWILFENVMSLHRTKATLIGLFEAGRVNEWVVTEKLGDSVNNNKKDAAKKTNVKAPKKRSKFFERLNLLELGFAAFLFICGCYDFVHGKHNYFIYLFLQTISFLIVGFGYVGTIV